MYNTKQGIKDIIRELSNIKLTGINNFYNNNFGNYARDAQDASDKCGYPTASLNNLLSHLTLDIQLNLNYYNHLLNSKDYDAIWSDDLLNYFNEVYDFEIYIGNQNNYNWDSNFERIIQFGILTSDNNDYLVLQVQFPGFDARCGYGYSFIYEMDDIDYIFDLLDACYVYIDGCENITIDILGGDISMYNHNTNDTIYLDYCDFYESLDILQENNIKIEVYDFEY